MKSIDLTQSLAPVRAAGDGSGKEHGLLLVAGEALLTTIPLSRPTVVIGRGEDCDVVLDDPTLSRQHARLVLDGRMTLEDLGSRNGTYLLRTALPVATPTPIEVGESFRIGRFSLTVVRRGVPQETGSVAGSAALRVLDPTRAGLTSLVREIAASDVNVLIQGETGVGKDVLANSLHQHSGRSGPFVPVNCAAIAPALIESELFGYEQGAFTGAHRARAGLVEAAAGGTLFLDEVGELSEPVQAKLLRVLETRMVLRVGGAKPLAVDVRFIAATHHDLAADSASGRFRGDLYFRLDGITLEIPPLRERPRQIAPLALAFAEAAHGARGLPGLPRLEPELLAALEGHMWPGNVRELKAVLERAVLLARGGVLGARHLVLRGAGAPESPPPATGTMRAWSDGEVAQRQRIIEALEACAGNQTRAAERLGVSRATLVNKLALYQIPRPRGRDPRPS